MSLRKQDLKMLQKETVSVNCENGVFVPVSLVLKALQVNVFRLSSALEGPYSNCLIHTLHRTCLKCNSFVRSLLLD